MDSHKRPDTDALHQQSNGWDRNWGTAIVEVQAAENVDWQVPIWIPDLNPHGSPDSEHLQILTMGGSSRHNEALENPICLAAL